MAGKRQNSLLPCLRHGKPGGREVPRRQSEISPIHPFLIVHQRESQIQLEVPVSTCVSGTQAIAASQLGWICCSPPCAVRVT